MLCVHLGLVFLPESAVMTSVATVLLALHVPFVVDAFQYWHDGLKGLPSQLHCVAVCNLALQLCEVQVCLRG